MPKCRIEGIGDRGSGIGDRGSGIGDRGLGIGDWGSGIGGERGTRSRELLAGSKHLVILLSKHV
ncbi:hypothetical protein BLD44_010105 [Mastigocladus laminosus UU774]|nr:hypothetical protein BLD44_010105 [Mastigocladus laminosus UU774]